VFFTNIQCLYTNEFIIAEMSEIDAAKCIKLLDQDDDGNFTKTDFLQLSDLVYSICQVCVCVCVCACVCVCVRACVRV